MGNKVKMKMPALPKGMKELRSSLAGWFARIPLNSVTGILRGSFEQDSKLFKSKRRTYRIEITNGETKCGTPKEFTICSVGETIGLDETGWLQKLNDLPAGSPVYVRYIGKGPDEKDAHVFQIAQPGDGE